MRGAQDLELHATNSCGEMARRKLIRALGGSVVKMCDQRCDASPETEWFNFHLQTPSKNWGLTGWSKWEVTQRENVLKSLPVCSHP